MEMYFEQKTVFFFPLILNSKIHFRKKRFLKFILYFTQNLCKIIIIIKKENFYNYNYFCLKYLSIIFRKIPENNGKVFYGEKIFFLLDFKLKNTF